MTKQSIISMIDIDERSVLMVRISTRIIDDDGVTTIAERFMRYILEPGDNVQGQPVKVRAIANLLWTPQVISDYQTWKAAQRPPL